MSSATNITDGKRAENFIELLSSEVLELTQNRSLTTEHRRQKFGNLVEKSFDLPLIARFVLGRPWNSATLAQRKEYLELFMEIVELTYSKRFMEYSGQTIMVTGHALGKRKFILVNSQLSNPTKETANLKVVWRLIPRKNSFKIIDVAIEGISMAITKRNEYSSVIQRSGGQLSALLDAMRKQIAKLKKTS
tara:strand:- start:1179 stop:1751 length:573 start_codon:yes stop_codon:yes gene_type:complete